MSYISICFHCYVIGQQLPSLILVVCFVMANILIANFIAGLGALLIVRTISVVTRVRHLPFTDGLCRRFLAIISWWHHQACEDVCFCRCSMHHHHEVYRCCKVQASVHLHTSNVAGVCRI